MASQADLARDLRLGLRALESGIIEPAELVSAIGEWVARSDLSFAHVLEQRGALTPAILARPEQEIAVERSTEQGDRDPGATVTYARRNKSEDSPPTRSSSRDTGLHALAGDRFEVTGPHARGGLGEVFLAFDRELKRSVALKSLQARLARDPDAQARFLREAEITGSLEHPGIVPVYSLGRYADGRPYYAMHLVRGETLRIAIERFHQKNSAREPARDRELEFRRLLRSVIDACNAIAYAHSRGVIHRDLKPENIMLGPFGETLVVDWGLAKQMDGTDGRESPSPHPPEPGIGASMTQPGSLIGTPRYMSPEQAAGKLDDVGPASDIYSLGAILYCVLVGHDAFPDGDFYDVVDRVARGIFPAPRRSRRPIDPVLEAICMKAMALDQLNRHATPLELATELESWLADVRYRDEQQAAVSQTEATVARLCVERAHACFDRKEQAEGMLWLARALEHASSSDLELESVIRTSLTGWHLQGNLVERSLRHGCPTHAVAFCPEGRRLVTGGEDGAARLWDLATGALFAKPLKHKGPVHSVSFSPDGKLVATASHQGTVLRWDAWTGEARGHLAAKGGVTSLIFSPDGSMLAARSNAGGLLCWNADGHAIEQSQRYDCAVAAIAFADDGGTFAVGYDDGTVRVDHAQRRPEAGATFIAGSAIRALAFDDKSKRLLTGNREGEASLWNVASRERLLTIPHEHGVRQVAFRPDGGAFATVCDDGSARLWESASGRPIGEPLGHGSPIDCLVFRPGGSMLAMGCHDGTIRLRCAVTGLSIGPPLQQAGTVRALAFSPDGRRLASGGSDHAICCWKVPSPVEGTPERISCWVRVMTELEFDDGDAIRRMDGATSWDSRRRLGELGGAPLR